MRPSKSSKDQLCVARRRRSTSWACSSITSPVSQTGAKAGSLDTARWKRHAAMHRRPEGPVAQRGIASRPPPSLHISSHAAPLALVLISNVITGLRVSHVRRIAYFALHRFYEKGFQTLMLAEVNGWVSVGWCRLAVLGCVCATCGPLFECCSLSIRWWITGTERWRCDIRKVEGGV